MSLKFFVEYEFQSDSGSKYWLPVYVSADTEADAENIQKSLEAGIASKFTITKAAELRPVIESLNSDFLANYAKDGLKGRRSVLRVNYIDMEALEPKPGWSFERHMKIVEASPEDYAGKKLGVSTIIDLPVSCIRDNWPSFEQLLIVDVVKPHTKTQGNNATGADDVKIAVLRKGRANLKFT
jgi:hypothetical protein